MPWHTRLVLRSQFLGTTLFLLCHAVQPRVCTQRASIRFRRSLRSIDSIRGPPSAIKRREMAKNILNIMSGQSLKDRDLVCTFTMIAIQVCTFNANTLDVPLISDQMCMPPGRPVEEKHALSCNTKSRSKSLGPARSQRETFGTQWCP